MSALHDIDVAVLLWLAGRRCGSLSELERAGELSHAKVLASLRRLERAGLYSTPIEKVLSGPAIEFLLHGLRFVFPGEVQRDRMVCGWHTAWSASPLDGRIHGAADPVVWPKAEGPHRGHVFEPIHEVVPKLARASAAFYARASLVDGIRGGRTRDRAEASALLSADLAA